MSNTPTQEWELHVFDCTDPLTEIDASEVIKIESTDDVGDVAVPAGCQIVGFQWAAPDPDGTSHLYVFINKDYYVSETYKWPKDGDG
jgi:hypothetical protein